MAGIGNEPGAGRLLLESRHPEEAAISALRRVFDPLWQPSKDAAQTVRPSPFEARGACHRAGHFGLDPLARTQGDGNGFAGGLSAVKPVQRITLGHRASLLCPLRLLIPF